MNAVFVRPKEPFASRGTPARARKMHLPRPGRTDRPGECAERTEARVGTVQQFPRAGGVFHVHDDAVYRAPPRGTEYFDDIRALQLSEEMQVRISRLIFDNNERGEMLDQTEIERLRHLPRLRMEQRTAAVALQPAPSRRRGEPYA